MTDLQGTHVAVGHTSTEIFILRCGDHQVAVIGPGQITDPFQRSGKKLVGFVLQVINTEGISVYKIAGYVRHTFTIRGSGQLLQGGAFVGKLIFRNDLAGFCVKKKDLVIVGTHKYASVL